MSKKYFLIGLLFFATPALGQFQTVEIPSRQKPLSVGLQTEYFRSQDNYEDWGGYDDLDNDQAFSSVLIRPKISYSPLKHLIRFHTFMDIFYAQTYKFSRYNSYIFQPSLIGAGGEFYHKIQNFFIGFQVLGAYPLYSSFMEQKPQQIIVGDGAYYGELALAFLFELTDNFYLYNRSAYRYRAYRYRGGGLSSLGWFNLGGVLDSQYLSTGLSVDTFISVPDFDDYSKDPDFRWNRLKDTNVGSYKFYSVNPSVVSFTAWMKFKYQTFKTLLYFNLDTIGKNYAKGMSLGLIAQWTWDTASRKNFLDKKKERHFDLERIMSPSSKPLPPENSSYYKEEQDPYLDEGSKKPINNELKEELELLNED